MGCGVRACPPRVCFWLHPPSCAVNAKGNEQALVLTVATFLRFAPCRCRENVVKECQEEASIPPELAAQAVPAGVVSYTALQVIAAHSKGCIERQTLAWQALCDWPPAAGRWLETRRAVLLRPAPSAGFCAPATGAHLKRGCLVLPALQRSMLCSSLFTD